MNKITKHIILMLALLTLALSGCQQEDAPYQRLEVDLPEGKITLAADTPEHEIKVTSSDPQWQVLLHGDWISARKEGDNRVVLKADKNETTNPRRAELLIVSGKLQCKVQIEQLPVAEQFAFMPKEVELPYWESSAKIGVSTNVADWKAESSAKWLKLTPFPTEGILEVEVTDNLAYTERVAKIYFTSEGKELFEYTITQRGMPYLILPHLGFMKADNEAIRMFEFGRGSALVSAPSAIINPKSWVFRTDSPIFYRVIYSIFDDSINDGIDSPENYGADENPDHYREFYKESKLLPITPDLLHDKSMLQEVIIFLEDNGFERVTQEYQIFYNAEKAVEAKINIEDSSIQFFYRPQEPNYPTIEKLDIPFDHMETYEEMLAFEAENGGTLRAERSNDTSEDNGEYSTYWFDVKEGEAYIARFYEVENSTQKIFSCSMMYPDLNLGLFSMEGTTLPTFNFVRFMMNQGFLMDQELEHRVFNFLNSEKRLQVLAMAWKDKEYPEGILQIGCLRY